MQVHDLFANSKSYSSFLLSFFMQSVKHRKYFFSFLRIKANSIINDRNKIISNVSERRRVFYFGAFFNRMPDIDDRIQFFFSEFDSIADQVIKQQ